MIYLLHGDNAEASRNELVRLRSVDKDAEYREIDGKLFDENAFVTALESQSLFGGKIFLIVERLFTNISKKPTVLKKIFTLTKDIHQEITLVFWEDKKCTDGVLKTFSNATIREFSYPKILFQYLDAVKPSNGKHVLAMLESLLQSDAPELVLFMTMRRIRELIALKSNTALPGQNAWQVSRLTSQNRAFTMDQLLSMHSYLTQSEYSLKSGATPFDCSHVLKQFVLEYLT